MVILPLLHFGLRDDTAFHQVGDRIHLTCRDRRPRRVDVEFLLHVLDDGLEVADLVSQARGLRPGGLGFEIELLIEIGPLLAQPGKHGAAVAVAGFARLLED